VCEPLCGSIPIITALISTLQHRHQKWEDHGGHA
jgi:hypothetical protein